MLLKSLKPIFQNLGLTDTDLKIYLHLLKHPGQNVNQLAKAGEVTRTNCYNYINALEQKGLIYLIPESKVNRFNATEPSQIKKLLKEVVSNSNEQLQILEGLSSKLESIQTQDPLPEVRYFKGKEGLTQLIKEAFSHEKFDVIYNSDPYNRLVFDLGAEINKWCNKHPKTQIREIRNHQYKGTKKHHDSNLYQLRFSTPELAASSRILLANKKVYLIKTSKTDDSHGTAIGICIEDSEIYNTHTVLFDLLWDNSTE